jgi:hypothetical protein
MSHNRRVKEALIIAFLGGLVTFSAFGAAILAVLAGGNVLDNVAEFWVARRRQRVSRGKTETDQREAQRRGVVSGILSGSVAVIQVFSGTGMVGCGLWLLFAAEDWKHPVLIAICYWMGVVFFIADAILITVLTGAAVLLVGVLPLFTKPSPNQGPDQEPDQGPQQAPPSAPQQAT